MHSNETNKIVCALLAVLTFTLGLSIFTGELFKPRRPAQPGYSVAVPEPAAPAGAQQAAGPVAVNMAEVMGAADASRGQQSFRPCQACHTVESGGPSRVGPNLYGVLGRQMAQVQGFNYSAALRAAGGANRQWSYEELYRFLENPRGHIPGTTMTFAGIRRGAERGDIIAYLRSLAGEPAPLPQ